MRAYAYACVCARLQTNRHDDLHGDIERAVVFNVVRSHGGDAQQRQVPGARCVRARPRCRSASLRESWRSTDGGGGGGAEANRDVLLVETLSAESTLMHHHQWRWPSYEMLSAKVDRSVDLSIDVASSGRTGSRNCCSTSRSSS